ncbi:unnamed protein product [Alternaria alternata]|uniref:Uncharacterized protein n=2 Tax=Alternaria alternata complex TaxID=187734 RepID=A0A4Q4NTG5_ALTAL|nr:hypothetical protein AA0115_g1489 [Alternaria tenuissima]RYN44790.1 hypothetical protein AA0114_g9657 [Alternaria tenuissima]RYN83093.1 hypothetical protein AA0117_g1120 [Alternaria alternata]RYO56533.1 hypothetical protein AA0116_g8943 [Alternaria tenuissima]
MPVAVSSTSAADTGELVRQTSAMEINAQPWLESTHKLHEIQTLKEISLGNCRLLYGSERFKFYGKALAPMLNTGIDTRLDIVICEDEGTKRFAAILTCNQDGQTKLLRTELSGCPVVAVRTLVDGLQKDTAKLFLKYAVGSQIRGQQGFTNKDTGKFELWDEAQEKRIRGPDDDTQGLVRSWSDAPGADGRPSSDRRGDGYHGRYNKRSRPVERPEKPMVEAEITDLDYYD